jgi:uncharacterized protein YndB with AHSA1/START domain
MAEYRFLTTWLLDAPRDEVWEAIYAIEQWPDWWRGVERVEKLVHGDGDGVGAVYAHRWRSVVPYPVHFRVTVERVERPGLIVARAEGELAGSGVWRLYTGDGTGVTYDWRVRTTRRWMNLVAPVARPVFAWNHHAVMRRGGEGLAALLGARLLARS